MVTSNRHVRGKYRRIQKSLYKARPRTLVFSPKAQEEDPTEQNRVKKSAASLALISDETSSMIVCPTFWGLGFVVCGSGFRVQSLGFGVESVGLSVKGAWSW